jgi:hypothetical protein
VAKPIQAVGVTCHGGECWAPLEQAIAGEPDNRERELTCGLRCVLDCELYPNTPCRGCPCQQHPRHQAWTLDLPGAVKFLAALRGYNDRRL